MPIVFARYVSSVPERLVTRWDNPLLYLGARRANAEELKAGSDPILWEPERVIPLTQDFCIKFSRELRKAIQAGDLIERTQKDFENWTRLEERIEEQREAERQQQAQAAAQAAEATTNHEE